MHLSLIRGILLPSHARKITPYRTSEYFSQPHPASHIQGISRNNPHQSSPAPTTTASWSPAPITTSVLAPHPTHLHPIPYKPPLQSSPKYHPRRAPPPPPNPSAIATTPTAPANPFPYPLPSNHSPPTLPSSASAPLPSRASPAPYVPRSPITTRLMILWG